MADKTIRRNIYFAAKKAGWEMPDYDQYETDMKIYRIGTKGNMKEVSRSEYDISAPRVPFITLSEYRRFTLRDFS